MLERSSDELSLAHYRVLSAVASGDERASRIAAKLALGKPTISASVDALCHRGVLRRVDVEHDLRGVALRLTPDGEALLQRVEAAMVERIDALADRTPDGDQMLDCLVWLGQAIEQALAERPAVR